MNSITVEEILENHFFDKVEIISGRKGIKRRVRWVHIMEVTDFSKLLDGQEMILTTGIGLSTNEVAPADYITQLIERDASCLCIELGTYLQHIDAEMLAVSEKYDFPIIIFKEKVKFVDITQSINSLLINSHYRNLQTLDEFSQSIQSFTAYPNGYIKIAQYMHNYIKFPVLCFPIEGEPYMLSEDKTLDPQIIFPKIRELCEKKTPIKKTNEQHIEGKTIISKPIEILNQFWGILSVIIPEEEPRDLIKLMLDRASLTISNHLLYIKFQEEKRLHQEQAWVNEIIHQNITNESQARAQLGSLNIDKDDINYRVFTLETAPLGEVFNSSLNSTHYHLALVIRNYFDQKGCHSFICQAKSLQLVVIVISFNSSCESTENLSDIEDFLQEQASRLVNYEYGFSQIYQQLTDASKAYQEAEQVIQLRHAIKNREDDHSPFFDELGIYQLLFSINSKQDINQFVAQQIGEPLLNEFTYSPYLYSTLREYLNCQCIKKDAAEKLYIARQTLYYRLSKIEHLLGYEIKNNHQKRLALEIALAFAEFDQITF